MQRNMTPQPRKFRKKQFSVRFNLPLKSEKGFENRALNDSILDENLFYKMQWDIPLGGVLGQNCR